jgi:hypothetical protein
MLGCGEDCSKKTLEVCCWMCRSKSSNELKKQMHCPVSMELQVRGAQWGQGGRSLQEGEEPSGYHEKASEEMAVSLNTCY